MRIKKFKYFESIDLDEYYTVLTEDEYDNLLPEDEPDFERGDYTVNFEKSEVDYIKSFLSNIYTSSYRISNVFYDRSYIDKSYMHYGTIIKLKDDWYLLIIDNLINNLLPPIYYKCDRLDGLEKCFKEKCV